MDIISALSDPKLLAPFVKDLATHKRWAVFYRLVFGLPLDEEDLEIARHHTEREFDRDGNPEFKEVICIAGRRGGKDYHVSKAVAFMAVANDYMPYLAVGERAAILVVAVDKQQAQIFMHYLRAIFSHPDSLFASMVEDGGIKAEQIDLKNNVTVIVKPCSFTAVRGYTYAAAVLSDVAFFRREGIHVGHEVANSIRPGLSTIPSSKMFYISTPYSRSGLLWDLYRENWAKPSEDCLVWVGTSLEMNPTLSARLIDRAMERSPTEAATEYGCEWREDLESFLAIESIERCVTERGNIPPPEGAWVRAHVDPSGGRQDAMAISLGWAHDGVAVVGAVDYVLPPFDPSDVVKRFADLMKCYDCYECAGDAYSAEWCAA